MRSRSCSSAQKTQTKTASDSSASERACSWPETRFGLFGRGAGRIVGWSVGCQTYASRL